MKKKKLKINMHRPLGTRVKYDDDGNVIPPLAALADKETGDGSIHLGTGLCLSNIVFNFVEQVIFYFLIATGTFFFQFTSASLGSVLSCID